MKINRLKTRLDSKVKHLTFSKKIDLTLVLDALKDIEIFKFPLGKLQFLYEISNYYMLFLIIGAYYYHHTEKGKNYEQTMLDVLRYAKKQEIPYRLEYRIKKPMQWRPCAISSVQVTPHKLP